MSREKIIDKIEKCIIAGYDIDIINQEEMGILWNYITNLQEENKRLNNIIKEVREYMENTPKIVKSIHLRNKESNFVFIENEIKKELLEILNKGESND